MGYHMCVIGVGGVCVRVCVLGYVLDSSYIHSNTFIPYDFSY